MQTINGKIQIKKVILFIIVSKEIKYLGKSLTEWLRTCIIKQQSTVQNKTLAMEIFSSTWMGTITIIKRSLLPKENAVLV